MAFIITASIYNVEVGDVIRESDANTGLMLVTEPPTMEVTGFWTVGVLMLTGSHARERLYISSKDGSLMKFDILASGQEA